METAATQFELKIKLFFVPIEPRKSNNDQIFALFEFSLRRVRVGNCFNPVAEKVEPHSPNEFGDEEGALGEEPLV